MNAGVGKRLVRALVGAIFGAIACVLLVMGAAIVVSYFSPSFGEIGGLFVVPAIPVGLLLGAFVGWRRG